MLRASLVLFVAVFVASTASAQAPTCLRLPFQASAHLNVAATETNPIVHAEPSIALPPLSFELE